MPGTIANPLGSLIEGLLQGHQLGMQIHQQQQADQQFKTQQILENQKISAQELLNQQSDLEHSRPVNNGTVQDQMNGMLSGSPGNPGPAPDQQPDLANLPTKPGPAIPQQFDYVRKADPSRLYTRTAPDGSKITRELYTPEEQNQRALQLQIGNTNALEQANLQAKSDAEQAVLNRQRQLRGVPIPPEFAGAFPAGTTKVLPEELFAQRQHAQQLEEGEQKIRGGNRITVKPGEKVIDLGPPGATQQQPGIIAQAPPLLSEPEQVALSAAQRVAAAHGIKFDRNLNPQDPRAQIPTQYHNEVDAVIARAKQDPAVAASMMQMRNLQAQAINDRRTDQSYALNNRELDNMRKPVDEQVRKVGELQDLLDEGSPQADALVPRKLLNLTSGNGGGRGSAEIERIVGGRSKWEGLKAAINKWSLDPKEANSLTPDQKVQIRSVVKLLADKATAKQKALDDAGADLIAYSNPTDHRKVVDKTRKTLADIDQGPAAAQAPAASYAHIAQGPGGHQIGSNDGKTWFDLKTGAKVGQ